MFDRSESHIARAFAADTNRVVARRVPVGVGFFVGVVAVSGLVEWVYYPERLLALGVSFGAEMGLCVAALLVTRSLRLRPWVIPIISGATIGIALCMSLYVAATGASGDAFALALIVLMTGIALLYPWGARGQVPLVVGTLGAYGLAVALGVRGDLPAPYDVLAIGGGAATSIFGAIFLDLHRGAIFHQRVLLERSRDQQLATLYDVSRTVTATLELEQVLRLVCQTILDAIRQDRLWLFWRDGPEGEVSGLEARRVGDVIDVKELSGSPGRWQAFLPVDPKRAPTLRALTPAEREALGDGSPVPIRLFELPLDVRADLVGVILADVGDGTQVTEAFLDFAFTLGTTAAMAITNARLHAQLLNHRGELQQLSNQGLAVVEDILRRLSRELHDNTCQALMVVKLDLALLERRFGAEAPGLPGAVDELRTQIVDVMQGVRQMSHFIYPPTLDDFGAIAAIESVAEKYEHAAGVRIRLTCSDPHVRFPPQVELTLFRVFQEALTNILKHANATEVQVSLVSADARVRIEIQDDGCGFDAHDFFRKRHRSAGLGLLGMRERVAQVGGKLRLSSTPQQGTAVVVDIPAHAIIAAEAATG